MRDAVRDSATLCGLLRLPEELRASARLAAGGFPVFVPHSYLARMRPGDPHDPLLRQVLPAGDELLPAPGFTDDPVGDRTARLTPGLLQKYAGRAMLITTGACAVHCRYCFRRHFPYQQAEPGPWSEALRQLRADVSIEEVLLSGGDPLVLPDHQLQQLAEQLDDIPHLRRLRVHTRLPIVIPQRVTSGLTTWLRATRLTAWMVVHANHPAELDESTGAALGRLVDAGIPVLNQSVLLRGVNDNADTLCELSRRLVDLRVTPYYLHQLDRVAGAAHFETPDTLGPQLIETLRARLPGFAVPRLVRETAGQPGKTILA